MSGMFADGINDLVKKNDNIENSMYQSTVETYRSNINSISNMNTNMNTNMNINSNFDSNLKILPIPVPVPVTNPR